MSCPWCKPGVEPKIPHEKAVDHEAPKGTPVVAHARTIDLPEGAYAQVFRGVIRKRIGSFARVRDLATGKSYDLMIFECFEAPP